MITSIARKEVVVVIIMFKRIVQPIFVREPNNVNDRELMGN